MSDHLQHGGRRRLLVAAAAVLAVAGALLLVLGLRSAGAGGPVEPPRTAASGSTSGTAPAEPAPVVPAPDATAPATVPESGSGGTTAAAAVPALGPVLPASEPVAVAIPSIGVDSRTLERLAVDATGALAAPVDYALPGWYTGGPNPGQFGPAVIAGHVDGPDGPAVFYRLGEVAVGATVDVTRADGTVATFVVDSVERYAKAEFPTSRVYGNTTDRAEIRLITCGGAFDRTTGHYVDNIVVFGHLVA